MPQEALCSAAELPDEIRLAEGDARVLLLDLKRAALGDGQIVSLSTPERGQLLVIGEAPGQTTAQLWMKDGTRHELRIVVLAQDLERKLLEVRRLLEGMPSVTARIAGDRILLEGSQVSAADQQRASGVAAMFPGQILDFVGRAGWEAMVQFDARVIEIRRDQLRQLGLRWATSIPGPDVAVALGAGADTAQVSLLSSLTSQIDLLQQRGLAQTIAEPTLSCRSGGVARFVSGGEIPLPVTDGLGATDVQYKEFGIILEVRPRTDSGGGISAEVDIELSQVDASLRVGDFPGFVKRRSSTAINVQSGQTIVIAGLVSRETSADRQGVPGLERLPGCRTTVFIETAAGDGRRNCWYS